MKRTIKLLVAILSVPDISVGAAKARYLDTIALLTSIDLNAFLWTYIHTTSGLRRRK